MPNIGAALKQEISRLARKESREQMESTRKSNTQHRKDIAALKERIDQLERQVKALQRPLTRSDTARSEPDTVQTGSRMRFAAKGLQALRARLELSATDLGKLLGVSPQSIYNWEHEKARPKSAQLAKLAEVRALGKRELAKRLENAT